jgi:hypothetical protein
MVPYLSTSFDDNRTLILGPTGNSKILYPDQPNPIKFDKPFLSEKSPFFLYPIGGELDCDLGHYIVYFNQTIKDNVNGSFYDYDGHIIKTNPSI